MEQCFDERAECVAQGMFDATSQAQTGIHTFLYRADKRPAGLRWGEGEICKCVCVGVCG